MTGSMILSVFALPSLAPPGSGKAPAHRPSPLCSQTLIPPSPRPSPFALHPSSLLPFTLHASFPPTVQLPSPRLCPVAIRSILDPQLAHLAPLTQRLPIPSALTPLCLSWTMEKLSPRDRQPTVSDPSTFHAHALYSGSRLPVFLLNAPSSSPVPPLPCTTLQWLFSLAWWLPQLCRTPGGRLKRSERSAWG